jgi:predicted transport protein
MRNYFGSVLSVIVFTFLCGCQTTGEGMSVREFSEALHKSSSLMLNEDIKSKTLGGYIEYKSNRPFVRIDGVTERFSRYCEVNAGTSEVIDLTRPGLMQVSDTGRIRYEQNSKIRVSRCKSSDGKYKFLAILNEYSHRSRTGYEIYGTSFDVMEPKDINNQKAFIDSIGPYYFMSEEESLAENQRIAEKTANNQQFAREVNRNSISAGLQQAELMKDALPTMYSPGTKVCKKKSKLQGRVEQVSGYNLKISFSDGKNIWEKYNGWDPC